MHSLDYTGVAEELPFRQGNYERWRRELGCRL